MAGAAAVGLLGSPMAANIVDDLSDTTPDRDRESVGQGLSDIASRFMGGASRRAMIGQSVIPVGDPSR